MTKSHNPVATILAQVSQYYSDKVRQFGATAPGADWKDQKGQEVRFEQLAKVTRGARTGSLIEIGCGWGAFAGWARANGFDLDYVGYDVSADMLRAAEQTFGQNPKIRFRLGSRPVEQADFVIASGIFNVRFELSDDEWLAYVDEIVDQMAAAAIKGFAFNCLTGFSETQRKEARLFYPYPGATFDRYLSRYGRHGAVLQDYGLYEFTMLNWRAVD